jgi:energy-coupling factor transport system permease protein
MQDARLRLGSTLLLSFAAFSSLFGAVLALLWWAIVARGERNLPGKRGGSVIFGAIILIAVFTQVFGGDGISYGFRMIVIMLIAFWAFGHGREGDLMNTAVWAFGDRMGFDLGLTAEMAVSSLRRIEKDIHNIRNAIRLKGSRGVVNDLITLGFTLTIMQIYRAREQGIILATRGYRGGGTYSPSFRRSNIDIPAFFGSFLIIVIIFISFAGFL